MITKDMEGKRLLVKLFPAMAEVCEVTVLEVTNSGFVKVGNIIYGNPIYGEHKESEYILPPFRQEIIEVLGPNMHKRH